ncbi:MAG: DUF5667 domain-containing protein [Candidatus Gottesmanbacteria bacterium]
MIRKLIIMGVFLLILITLNMNTPRILSAQQKTTTEVKEASISSTINYTLAYPGMLPDNPLYKLKVLRDKLSIMFINNPLKKVEFYLLQVDKGILASAMLVDKNNIELAGQTALKAENNYTLLTQELNRLNKKPDANFLTKLKTASRKHQEVLESIIQRLPANQQEDFKNVLYFSKSNLMTVEKFETKRFYEEQ